MELRQLARALRKRQHKLGEAPTWAINTVSDTGIVQSYIKCSGCGEQQVPDEVLPWLIEKAQGVDHFFAMVDTMHVMAHGQPPACRACGGEVQQYIRGHEPPGTCPCGSGIAIKVKTGPVGPPMKRRAKHG